MALTIAGFDPSGGAGVLADARTFVALGCRASAVITSITFQDSDKVMGAVHQSAASVRGQLMPLTKEHPAAVKTGMLPTAEIVLGVAQLFRDTDLPAPIVDPVIISSSGYRLMEEEAVAVLLSELLPFAGLITPNIPEAEQLAAMKIASEAGMREAAARIRKLGARAVLIKGGHLASERREHEPDPGDRELDFSAEAIDVLDNEGSVTVFRDNRVPGGRLHGTGCIMSAAIAACRAKEMSLEDCVNVAKQFVLNAIRKSLK